MLKNKIINKLQKTESEWCVSLYLPVTPNDIQKNRTRLRKLMFEAERKPLDLKMPIDKVARILLPIEEILNNNFFWKNKQNGLAIFLSPNSFNWHQLNLNYQEMAIVANRFYLKPLVNSRKNLMKVKVQNLIQSKISPNQFQPQREYTISLG